MAADLKRYFPFIRERREVLEEIQARRELSIIFEGWPKEYQEEFLDFVTGVRGVKLLYDPFFKEILNPEFVPERVGKFLSLVLGEVVRVVKVLPNDSVRIADEASLLITDVVVELEDGSIANVECQKIGYLFPGQRSACYSADLLLRQYKRVRGGDKNRCKRFSYRNIKRVYTIVLFQRSPKEFHICPESYIHHMKQKSDTELKLELLQEFVFIPLDIFLKHLHNRGINSDLDAWLAFLGSDDPAVVAELCSCYPAFRAMYEEVYEMCQSVEKVMEMFSKELLELDRNTVQYMIDEQQITINEMQTMINERNDTINEQNSIIDDLRRQLEVLQAEAKNS